MENTAKLNSILSGISGEYLVASELSRRGYIATVTLKNTKGIDILAANENAQKIVGIQVKTNQKNRLKWLLSKDSEQINANHLFYILVNLNSGTNEPPDFYIVPSKAVAATIKKRHKDKISQGIKDTPIREYIISENDKSKYHNQWAQLGLD